MSSSSCAIILFTSRILVFYTFTLYFLTPFHWLGWRLLAGIRLSSLWFPVPGQVVRTASCYRARFGKKAIIGRGREKIGLRYLLLEPGPGPGLPRQRRRRRRRRQRQQGQGQGCCRRRRRRKTSARKTTNWIRSDKTPPIFFSPKKFQMMS